MLEASAGIDLNCDFAKLYSCLLLIWSLSYQPTMKNFFAHRDVVPGVIWGWKTMSEIHFHLVNFHFQFSLCVKVHACMNVKTVIETLSMAFHWECLATSARSFEMLSFCCFNDWQFSVFYELVEVLSSLLALLKVSFQSQLDFEHCEVWVKFVTRELNFENSRPAVKFSPTDIFSNNCSTFLGYFLFFTNYSKIIFSQRFVWQKAICI